MRGKQKSVLSIVVFGKSSNFLNRSLSFLLLGPANTSDPFHPAPPPLGLMLLMWLILNVLIPKSVPSPLESSEPTSGKDLWFQQNDQDLSRSTQHRQTWPPYHPTLMAPSSIDCKPPVACGRERASGLLTHSPCSLTNSSICFQLIELGADASPAHLSHRFHFRLDWFGVCSGPTMHP